MPTPSTPPELINYTALPKDPTGVVAYVVPPDTFVVEDDGSVFASPGDHVHGRISKLGITLGRSVKPCPVCADNFDPLLLLTRSQ